MKFPLLIQHLSIIFEKGQLKTKCTTYDGIEHMLKAFEGLFKGENLGKCLVKAINEQTHWGRI
jgi:NADPH-dependent curcumin reductase CurA